VSKTLSRSQLLKYLGLLNDKLAVLGAHGEILLVGEVAMRLVHEARDMTKDIEALYEPNPLIQNLALKIAHQEGLPEDWLNDAAKGFVGPNAPQEKFLSLGALDILAVSGEYLLAMKMASSRYGEADANDIIFLLDKLGLKNAEEAIELLLKFFPKNQILPKTQYLLDEAFEMIKAREMA
jgi:hypothetical protein